MGGDNKQVILPGASELLVIVDIVLDTDCFSKKVSPHGLETPSSNKQGSHDAPFYDV